MLGTGSGTETNAIERPPRARRHPSFQRAAVITFHRFPSPCIVTEGYFWQTFSNHLAGCRNVAVIFH